MFDQSMSGMKKLGLSVTVGTAVIATSAANADMLETFASCTGRLSAEVEHAWLMGAGEVDYLTHQRSEFIALLTAVTPPDQNRQALAIRIDAKMAHSEILTLATFSRDNAQMDWALKQAARHIRGCTELLLTS